MFGGSHFLFLVSGEVKGRGSLTLGLLEQVERREEVFLSVAETGEEMEAKDVELSLFFPFKKYFLRS